MGKKQEKGGETKVSGAKEEELKEGDEDRYS